MKKTIQEQYEYIESVLSSFDKFYENRLSKRSDRLAHETKEHLDMRNLYLILQIAYRSLKIHTICQLLSVGETAYAAYIEDTYETLLDCVKELKKKYTINQKVRKEAGSYLFLLCAEYQDILFPYIHYRLSLPGIDSINFPFAFYENAFGMATYFKEFEDHDAAISVIRHLCLDHLQYLDWELHKEHIRNYVSASLLFLAYDDHELTDAICVIFDQLFDQEKSVMSGDFYWFWGNAAFPMDQFSKGEKCLQKCMDIRKDVYGPNHILTVSATCERIIRKFEVAAAYDDIKYLCQVVEKIEKHAFDDSDYNKIRYLEGKILFYILRHETLLQSQQAVLSYLDLFDQICNLPNIPHTGMISPRVAKNMRGIILSRHGQYLSAEKYFKEALAYDTSNDKSVDFLSYEQIKINLLQLYYEQNDEQFFPLLDELVDLVTQDHVKGFDDNDYHRLNLMVLSSYELDQHSDISMKDRTIIFRIIQEACERLIDIKDHLSLRNKNHVSVIINGIFLLLSKKIKIESEDARRYADILLLIKEQLSVLQLEKSQIASLYYAQMFLYRYMQQSDSDMDICIKEALAFLRENEIHLGISISIYIFTAYYYYENNKIWNSMSCITSACEAITKSWQENVKCLNDARLTHFLYRISRLYHTIYALQRRVLSTYDCYEAVLKYKALASLAGRERNRILNAGSMDLDLMKRIRKLQDHVAVLESKSSEFNNHRLLDDTKEELRILESAFSEKFPKVERFTEISLERIMDQLPDNTVVVEYFYTFSSLDEDKKMLLLLEKDQLQSLMDIYILKKKNGVCSLHKIVISGVCGILDSAGQMLASFQNSASNKASIEELSMLETLNRELYDSLIGPVTNYLKDMEVLYIAPCTGLANLPFGLLKNADGIRLMDQYVLIKMECARDFLFHAEDTDLETTVFEEDNKKNCDTKNYNAEKYDVENNGKNISGPLPKTRKVLIMGDPVYQVKDDITDKSIDKKRNKTIDKQITQLSDNIDFEYQEDIGTSSSSRMINWNQTNIASLPFSGIEALRIHMLVPSDCYTGMNASKNRLLQSIGYDCVHLATHEFVDYRNDTDTLYASCLLLTGAQNWIAEGKQDPSLGNGIVTADEISRQDWSNVELVVLSSCMSGLNHSVVNKEFNGMVSALSAAGVHYVICSLWNQSDLAAAVMMEEFYRCYKEGSTPYEALRSAQNYLKDVSIMDLKQKGWLSLQDSRIQKIIQQYAQLNDRRKPFRNEVFWGGFECIRCN